MSGSAKSRRSTSRLQLPVSPSRSGVRRSRRWSTCDSAPARPTSARSRSSCCRRGATSPRWSLRRPGPMTKSQARRPLDRRRQRRREPLHHRRRWKRRTSGYGTCGQEPDCRLRRRSPGQVERLHRGVRWRDRRRHQRRHQERHQHAGAAVQSIDSSQGSDQLSGGNRETLRLESGQLRHRRVHRRIRKTSRTRLEPGFARGRADRPQPCVVLRRISAGADRQRSGWSLPRPREPGRRDVRRGPEGARCST